MSSPVIATEVPRKEFSWKRLFINAAGFGAGFALVLAALAGAGIWYSNRPKPPKPWDRKTITATYQRVGSLKENSHYLFWYVLENHGNEDVNITDSSEIDTQAMIDKDTLDMCSDCLKLKYPIFIPAKRSLRISIEFTYPYPNAKNPQNAEERKQETKEIESYLTNELPRLGGFVIFDKLNRVEIDLGSGWKDVAQSIK